MIIIIIVAVCESLPGENTTVLTVKKKKNPCIKQGKYYKTVSRIQ